MPEPVVICRDVGKTYPSRTGSIEALHSIDVSVAAGTLAALVGPSGCGKSTLLRLLAGLDVADHGTLAVAERDPTTLRGRALRAFWRERVTYVAQRPSDNLVPHLTLRQHLSDPTDLRVLERLGLSGKLDRRASLLSGGEQARARPRNRALPPHADRAHRRADGGTRPRHRRSRTGSDPSCDGERQDRHRRNPRSGRGRGRRHDDRPRSQRDHSPGTHPAATGPADRDAGSSRRRV